MVGYLKGHYKADSWGKPVEVDGKGKPTGKKANILLIASVPGIPAEEHEDDEGDRASFTKKPVDYCTLIITHRLSDQMEIQKIITSVLYGKPAEDFVPAGFSDDSMGGGGGFGGGGGAFQIPSKRRNAGK